MVDAVTLVVAVNEFGPHNSETVRLPLVRRECCKRLCTSSANTPRMVPDWKVSDRRCPDRVMRARAWQFADAVVQASAVAPAKMCHAPKGARAP